MPTKRKYLLIKRNKKLKKKFGAQQIRGVTVKREKFNIQPLGWTISKLKLEVLKMQMNLAVAIRNQNTDSVNHWVNKILRSSTCRYWSIYKTISSPGARSKGIGDQTRPITNKQYLALYHELWEIVKSPKNYKSSPLKRIWIPKPNSTELRPISVPSYIDRAIQQLHLIILDVFQEEFADVNSYGFRSFRSPGWAAKAVTLYIWSRKKFGPPKYAIELDIRKCFDSISHDFLKHHVGKVMVGSSQITTIHPNILQQWLKSGYIDVLGTLSPKTETVPTIMGIPQGGPISPTMANMVLNGIEKVVANSVENFSNDKKLKLSPEDKIIWYYEGQEVFGSFNLTEKTMQTIRQQMVASGHPLPKAKAIVRNFLDGTWPHTRAGWSYKYINPNNSMQKYRNKINNSQAKLFRFADDCVIFANSKETIDNILQNVNSFLSQRGLEINQNKTKVKNIQQGEKFQFVGFEFAVTRNHGKWSVHNYPPQSKIKRLKQKVNETLIKYKTRPYLAFYNSNAIIRGWLNFYSTGNSSRCFNTIRNWLFYRILKYLEKFYSYNPIFRKSSQKRYKKKIYSEIYKNNYISTYYSPTGAKWFAIPTQYIPNKVRFKEPYFLINPGYFEVSTPTIIVGKSCYIPDERLELQNKAIYWQKGILKTLLIKSGGLCKVCNCTLVDLIDKPEIHHIKPLGMGGPFKFTNLALLCRDCHKDVTTAVKSKNIDQIISYEESKVLKDVSFQLMLDETND